jgi:ABC-type transporter Mla subunit MlaD
MSSKRFEIDIGLNASEVAKGANDGKKALADLEKAVGDVADESGHAGGKVDSFASKLVDASRKAGKSDDDIKDALRQMGLSAKQAERAVEDVGDEFKETGRDGERAADKLEDSLRDVQRQADKTADEVGDVGEKGFRKLGDAGEEVSGELKQNLGETFSSFRGDLEDLPQIAQDVFGGLAGSVGTLPAAFALAAGAAGIGLLISGFEQVREQEEARKERVAEWAAAYIGGLSQMEGALADFASIEAIYTDPERYAEAGKNAKLWGVDVSVAVNAMAGDMTALGVVQDNLAKKTAELEAVNIRNAAATGEGRDRLKELEIGLRDGTTAYQQITGEMAEGREIANAYSESLLQILGSAESAGEEVDDLGNKVYTLPDGRQIMIDAETGQATTDLNKFKGDADNVINSVNGREAVVHARVAGLDQVRVDLDALTRPRTMTVTAKLSQSFSQNMGWDK